MSCDKILHSHLQIGRPIQWRSTSLFPWQPGTGLTRLNRTASERIEPLVRGEKWCVLNVMYLPGLCLPQVKYSLKEIAEHQFKVRELLANSLSILLILWSPVHMKRERERIYTHQYLYLKERDKFICTKTEIEFTVSVILVTLLSLVSQLFLQSECSPPRY